MNKLTRLSRPLSALHRPVSSSPSVHIPSPFFRPSLSLLPSLAFSPSRPFSLSAVHSMDELRDAVESATAANKLTVIEWKATWCGKCKTLQKELERLSAAHPEVEFRLADVDEGDLKEGKKEAGIDHLPVVHFIKDGELVHQIVGVRVNEMTKTIEKYAGKGGHQQSTGGNEATKAQAPTGS